MVTVTGVVFQDNAPRPPQRLAPEVRHRWMETCHVVRQHVNEGSSHMGLMPRRSLQPLGLVFQMLEFSTSLLAVEHHPVP